MSEIKVFTNEKFGEIRILENTEEIWFVGKDVAEKLGYSNPRDALAKHVAEDDKAAVAIYDGSQTRHVIAINESGMYSLILSSKLESAKEFKHWVTSEVLPSIRKTGSYTIPGKGKEELATMEHSNRIAEANFYAKLAEKYSHNKDYEQILDAYATKALEGKFVLPLPKLEEENFSATEAGKMLGISANKFGSIAIKMGLKVDGEYGKWYVDKARNSNKEVNTFRYTQKAIDMVRSSLD